MGIDPSLSVHAGIGHDDDACELLGINELDDGEYDIKIIAVYEDGSRENLVGAQFKLKVGNGGKTEENTGIVTDTRLANM